MKEEKEAVIPQDERVGTLIFSAFLLILGVLWIIAASDLPSRQQTAYLSQGFLPIAAGIILTVVSALLLVSYWRTPSRPAGELGKEPLFEPRAQLKAAAVFGTLLGYIILLPTLHFLLSTFLLMAAGLAIAGEPLRPRLLVRAATMAGLFFAIFVWGLQIAVPGGRFGL